TVASGVGHTVYDRRSAEPIDRHRCEFIARAGGYRRCSTQVLTLASAAGSFSGIVPPACAISGRPPPLPPTCVATWLTRSPALMLPVRSDVTPTITVTLGPSVEPSTIAADLNLPLS